MAPTDQPYRVGAAETRGARKRGCAVTSKQNFSKQRPRHARPFLFRERLLAPRTGSAEARSVGRRPARCAAVALSYVQNRVFGTHLPFTGDPRALIQKPARRLLNLQDPVGGNRLNDAEERFRRAQRSSKRGGTAGHADDGAIYRDQGRQSGLPAVLPDGRFLRAVLRGRRNRRARARHRADQARQASRPRHPDVRRAGRSRRRIPAPADRARPSRRRLRAARGPGRGEEARRQERGAPRRRAAGHARHADRGHAARCAAQQLPARDRARARVRRRGEAASRSPGSISRPANSALANATVPRLRPRSRGSSRARSSSPTRSTPTPSSRPSCARCRR